MRRARQRLIALTGAGLLLVGAEAGAYHAGADFAKPAAAGGGGGLYFSGARSERGWDCTTCHIGAPGRAFVAVGAKPSSLLAAREYVAGQSYELTFTLRGEHRGLDAPLNLNAISVLTEDRQGIPVGGFGGYAPDALVQGATPAGVVTNGVDTSRPATKWVATWTAPTKGAGRVWLRVAAVDGDGASIAGSKLRTGDPLNDDVFVGSLELEEKGNPQPTAESGCAVAASRPGDSWPALVIILLALVCRGRAPTGSWCT